jgi:hypothetical protein
MEGAPTGLWKQIKASRNLDEWLPCELAAEKTGQIEGAKVVLKACLKGGQNQWEIAIRFTSSILPKWARADILRLLGFWLLGSSDARTAAPIGHHLCNPREYTYNIGSALRLPRRRRPSLYLYNNKVCPACLRRLPPRSQFERPLVCSTERLRP